MFPRICTTMATPPRQPPAGGSTASRAKAPTIMQTSIDTLEIRFKFSLLFNQKMHFGTEGG